MGDLLGDRLDVSCDVDSSFTSVGVKEVILLLGAAVSVDNSAFLHFYIVIAITACIYHGGMNRGRDKAVV